MKQKTRKIYAGRAIFMLLLIVTVWKIIEKGQRKNRLIRSILSWNSFFGDQEFMSPSVKQLNCLLGTCHITMDRDGLDHFDAIVMHWRDVDVSDLPQKRIGQRIILLNYESPRHTSSSVLSQIQGLVDWTISYRLDSDVVSPYGKVTRNTHTATGRYENTVAFEKKRLVAWMVSDCLSNSHRRDIVNQLLQNKVPIDEYGRCPTGNSSLANITRDEAYRFLAQRYKFYLAFENSLCRDYATEKMYQPLYHGMVPVVFGGSNYKKLLPANSYIDVLDFPSLKDLAEHLKLVESNETLYGKYHEWRNLFQVLSYDVQNNFFCEICEKLHNPHHRLGFRKSDLLSWWNEKKDCFSLSYYTTGEINLPGTAIQRQLLYLPANEMRDK